MAIRPGLKVRVAADLMMVVFEGHLHNAPRASVGIAAQPFVKRFGLGEAQTGDECNGPATSLSIARSSLGSWNDVHDPIQDAQAGAVRLYDVTIARVAAAA